MSSNQVSPILSLDSDVWTFIGTLLESGDVLRLASTGCTRLTTAVSRGARRLCLDWTSSRYLDFAEVCRTTSRFGLISHLKFGATNSKFLWKSPSGPLLAPSFFPSTLRLLRLKFRGAVNLVLQRRLDSVLPLLETLIVEDLGGEKWGSTIDLRFLPASLTHLCISSRRTLLVAEHLSLLPPNLSTLRLDFDPVGISERELEHELADSDDEESELSEDCGSADDGIYVDDEDGGGDEEENEDGNDEDLIRALHRNKSLLPTLPATITHLSLEADHHTWHLDCSTLPPSLTRLELNVQDAHHSIGLGEFDTTIDLTHAGARLTNLKTIDAPRLDLSLMEIATLIPPSVTHLNVRVSDADATYLDEAMEFLKTRLTELNVGYSRIDKIVLGGKVNFSRLRHLSLHLQIGLDDIVLPASLESVDYLASNFDSLPAGLTVLALRWLPKDISLNLGQSITVLYLPYGNEIEAQHVAALPPSLVRLHAHFTEDPWVQLLDLMLLPSRLPNLSYLRSSKSLPMHCLHTTPKQLRELDLTVSADSLLEVPDEALLKSLRDSCLNKLDLSSSADGWKFRDAPRLIPQIAATIAILRALPQSLRELRLHTPCVPSPHWHVVLPPLKILEYTFPSGQQVLHDAENTGEKFSVEPIAPSFALPSTLHTFISSSDLFKWPLSQLPPHLSTLTLHNQEDSIAAYFASQSPPPHLPGFQLYQM